MWSQFESQSKMRQFAAELELPSLVRSSLDLHEKLIETKRANNAMRSSLTEIYIFIRRRQPSLIERSSQYLLAPFSDNYRKYKALIANASTWSDPDNNESIEAAQLCSAMMCQLNEANQRIDALLTDPLFMFSQV
jgi:hypothetical protein